MNEPIGLDSLQRFVTDVPSLRRLLQSPATTERELSLRAEMRLTLRKLSDTLCEAADREVSRTHAALLRATAAVAAQLAAGRVPVRRDH